MKKKPLQKNVSASSVLPRDHSIYTQRKNYKNRFRNYAETLSNIPTYTKYSLHKNLLFEVFKNGIYKKN